MNRAINCIEVKLNKSQFFTVYGGPYRLRPQDMMGVKMAREIELPCDVSIPTQDFSIPTREAVDLGLAKTIDLILEQQAVYVGCAGGIGRTGLFLAILTKCFGVKDPIAFVRKTYHPHAVETKEQRDFVESYKAPALVRWNIRVAKVLFWALKKNGSLTN